MPKKKPSVISLFTGAGGLDLGFHAAGLKTAVAVEMDDDACNTLRTNAKRAPSEYPWEVIQGRIEDISSQEILDAARLEPGEADVLVGGPPCQPFSKSGYWSSGDSARLEDPRAATLWHYLRVLRETLPKTFLLENVAGLAYTGKEEGLEFIRDELHRINEETGARYSFGFKVLNAADFGVPQVRERIFLVGSQDGTEFEFPERRFVPPTHEPELFESKDQLPTYRTAWDALGGWDDDPDDLEETAVRGKWADLLPSVPEGDNYLYWTQRGGGSAEVGGQGLFGWRRRYWSFLLKLSKRKPSWTLTAKPGPAIGPFHWESRRLARRELAALQTFPEGYEITGSLSDVQRQLGNAVPSLLAEVLARKISKDLLDMKVSETPTLLPPKRESIPSEEAVVPLAKKYRPLLGFHDAHPGTGRGYSYANQAG